MNSGTILNVLLGVLAVGAPVSAFFAASRATRVQATASITNAKEAREAAQVAVDAAAYERARQIYEGALQTLHGQADELNTEVLALREENMGLRRLNATQAVELTRLGAEVAALRAR